ncbi:hypothetical protein [Trichocoleus sp. FACHB-262]|uniref:hypothetical protein n=1 Tax=Trichocoleus sp. FACHB-262 TaxID=2692869 RepID=UPI0016863024|nr:hypothetical protein [Trichocoleus sp. FACHB-262]MBD2124763.1 hypothetical protein [Trichocoleus sp. FACHB-262]
MPSPFFNKLRKSYSVLTIEESVETRFTILLEGWQRKPAEPMAKQFFRIASS